MLKNQFGVKHNAAWVVGEQHRGMGHYSYAVLDEQGEVVVECGLNLELAQLISRSPKMLRMLQHCTSKNCLGDKNKGSRKRRFFVEEAYTDIRWSLPGRKIAGVAVTA